MACTLVNCTNCYEKKDIIPELVQLAKFSKQHVPEQHPKVRHEEKETTLLSDSRPQHLIVRANTVMLHTYTQYASLVFSG